MNESTHKLTKFFLVVSVFAIATSILAIYTTIVSSQNSSKKNDLQVETLSHLTNSTDWWNDYQFHKLREKIYQVQIDNINNTIHQQLPQLSKHDKDMYAQTFSKYQSLLDKLHANKSVTDSIAYLGNKASAEMNLYTQSLVSSKQISNTVETFDMITILLIIGAGLTGIAEISKNKMLAYAGFSIGGCGLLILVLSLFGYLI